MILRELIRNILQNRFAKDVLLVVSGATGARILSMAFAPFITRIYGPEAFGHLGVFTAIVEMVVPIAAMSYPIAIVLAREDCEAKGLAILSMYIAIVFSMLIWVGLSLSASLGLVDKRLDDFIFLIPFAVLIGAALQVVKQWNVRKKKFKLTARADVLQSLISGGAVTGIGFFYPISGVLIFFSVFKNFIHGILLAFGVNDIQCKKKMSDVDKLKELAKKYYDFPVYRAPQLFINAITQSLPVLALAIFFGSSSAGFYSIAIIAIGIPSSIIGKSVASVFYERIVEAYHKRKNISETLYKVTSVLAVIGFLPFVFIFALGPEIFWFVFGEKWIIAGEYARWLSILLYFRLLSKPCINALPVLKAQRFFLFFSLISMIARLSALFIGYFVFASDVIAVILFCVSGSAFVVVFIMIVYSKSKNYKNE